MNTFNNSFLPYRNEAAGFNQNNQDGRFLPFLAGAALAAPLFLAAGRPCVNCVVPVPVYPPFPPQPYPYPLPTPTPYPYPLPTPYGASPYGPGAVPTGYGAPFASAGFNPVGAPVAGAAIGAGLGTAVGAPIAGAAIGAGLGTGFRTSDYIIYE